MELYRQTFLRVAFWIIHQRLPARGGSKNCQAWDRTPSLFPTPRQSHSSVRNSGRWDQGAKVGEVWFNVNSTFFHFIYLFFETRQL